MEENVNKEGADPKYEAELEQLEKGTSGDGAVESTESDSQLVEKDGEFYLSDDTEDTLEPAEGETNVEEVESDVTTNLVDENDIYASKSKEEIIEMHQNAQKRMGEQGDELGKLRDIARNDEDLTDEEVFEKLSADDLSDGLKTEKQKLDNMDPYDIEARESQQELIREIENDLITKRTQENIASRMDSRDNQQFEQKQREILKSQGIDISDDDFSLVSDNANHYKEDGLLTEKSFHKALVDRFGLDHVVKNLTMSGEKKARADIKTAAGKTTEKVDVKGSGKASKLIRISDLGRRELRSKLDTLSLEDVRKLRKQHMNK